MAAEKYLKDLEDGKLGVIGENRFFDGVKMQSPPSNNGSYLTQFIELQQYYKGSFFNEVGLSASFNMKREAIGEGEATLNEDTLAPLIDTMLQCRQEDVSRLNEMFDLNITVEFDSAWAQNIEESKLEMLVMESDAKGEEDGRDSEFRDECEGRDCEEESCGVRVDDGAAGDSEVEHLDTGGEISEGGEREAEEDDSSDDESETGSDNDDNSADPAVDNIVNVNIFVDDVSQLTEMEEGDIDGEDSED